MRTFFTLGGKLKTEICEMFGIDIPLIAFSHCRNVVVEVSKAGGLGVFGAMRYSPEELEQELAWIDANVQGKPYGVDLVIPAKLEGKGEEISDAELVAKVPQGHVEYVEKVLADSGMDLQVGELITAKRLDDSQGQELLDVTFRHPVKLIANALGVPPQFMIDRAHQEGVPIGALVGSAAHAVKQVTAGVDFVVAQGTEAGGHCGEISTLVLVPEVVEAVKSVREVPVLAAGGIVTGRQMAGAVAMGAAGAWTGSVWLTTPEAETAPYTVERLLRASSQDTIRSKGRTGKPCRQLKSAWTEAWEQPGGPAPLPMPLQTMLATPALQAVDELAARGHAGAQALATYYVGQGVGLMKTKKHARDVVLEFAEDYILACERLVGSLDS